MNTDIRLSVDFWDHPKTMKLERRLGLEGIKALLQLWAWTAKNRPDGDFLNMDSEDVEIAARWAGEEGQLVETLVNLRWLDQTDVGYLLHDWEDHNSWAAEACDRSAKARLSRLAQVNKAAHAECQRRGVTSLSLGEYKKWKRYRTGSMDEAGNTGNAGEASGESSANAGAPLAPAPAPSPTPGVTKMSPDGDTSAGKPALHVEPPKAPKPSAAKSPNCPHQEIADLYNATLPMLPQVKELTAKRKNHLRARWQSRAECRELAWWKSYFALVAKCSFLLGAGDRGWRASFDWLINPSNMINVLEGKFLPKESTQVATMSGAAGGTYKPRNMKEVKEMDSYAQSLDIQRLRKEVRLDG